MWPQHACIYIYIIVLFPLVAINHYPFCLQEIAVGHEAEILKDV